MRESKCYISVACFHYGGSDLLRFGKFEVLITSQALLSQKQPIFMQNYNFVKNDVFVAKICKYALYESSEGLFCAPRKAANFCHPACDCKLNKNAWKGEEWQVSDKIWQKYVAVQYSGTHFYLWKNLNVGYFNWFSSNNIQQWNRTCKVKSPEGTSALWGSGSGRLVPKTSGSGTLRDG